MLSCSSGLNVQSDAHNITEPVPVEVVAVSKRMMDRSIRVVGSIQPFDLVTLRTKVPGYLGEILVDVGNTVEQDNLMARIEDEDYRLALNQAEAALSRARARLGISLNAESGTPIPEPEETGLVMRAQAEINDTQRTLMRQQELHESGLLSTADLDQAMTAYELARHQYQVVLEEALERQAALLEAEAARDLAAKQLRDIEIVAPFDGIVQERFTNVGEYLSVDAPILSVVSIDRVRIQLQVPERQAGLVRVGQQIQFYLEDQPGSSHYESQVVRVSPSLQADGRVLYVEGDHPFIDTLRPGVFIRGSIVVQKDDMVLAVPEEAVVAFVGIERVLLVDGERVREHEVRTGQRHEGWVEILDGLSEGDLVIQDPHGIRHGDLVTFTATSN